MLVLVGIFVAAAALVAISIATAVTFIALGIVVAVLYALGELYNHLLYR